MYPTRRPRQRPSSCIALLSKLHTVSTCILYLHCFFVPVPKTRKGHGHSTVPFPRLSNRFYQR